MTTFFSVDVETSGTDPFKFDLLTIGARLIREDGLLGDGYYTLIDHGRDVVWDDDTKAWWLEQNAAAKREIFSTDLPSDDPRTVAASLAGWVRMHGGSGFHDNTFVANPSSFDHAWIRKLFSYSTTPDPFSYRTLCLRSAGWGAGSSPWSETQRSHVPFIPHHSLHDAQAQALDFLDLLKGRNS
jgi:3' exoribonuclease, RNase T-like